jgi:hypothetical protein
MLRAMRARLGALLAIVFMLVPAAVAVAHHIEVGASREMRYKGSDVYGRVSFDFGESDSSGKHPVTTLTIRQFRFANECSRVGTKVPGRIRVRANGRFHSTAHGFTVTGRLVGRLQSRAVGTAQESVDCDGDSDPVSFTAHTY